MRRDAGADEQHADGPGARGAPADERDGDAPYPHEA